MCSEPRWCSSQAGMSQAEADAEMDAMDALGALADAARYAPSPRQQPAGRGGGWWLRESWVSGIKRVP